jgi:type I restriction enzyme S subunit
MRDGWVDATLGDLISYSIGGIWGDDPGNSEIDVPVYRQTEFNDSGRLTTPADAFRSITESQLKSRTLLYGDILIQKSAGTPTLPGRVVMVPDLKNEVATFSNFLNLLRPDQTKCIPRFAFLYFWFKHQAGRAYEFQRGTNIKNLDLPNYLEETIFLPPLHEQKRIVDLISSVDSYIEALQQQLDSAKKSRNAVLHELLTAGGDDWEYKTLSDICEVRDGTHDSPKPSHEGFALVTSKNIKDGKLDLESAYLISPQDYIEINKRSKVEQFNLLISMIGTIGEVIVIEDKPNFAIKNVGLLKSTEPILSRYLCHYLGSQLGKNAISLSVSGSTQKFISLGKLRGLPVLYPPRENQKAIVEAMSLFDQQISKNLEVAARIKNLRSSMLSDLLSGEHQIPSSYDKVMGAA